MSKELSPDEVEMVREAFAGVTSANAVLQFVAQRISKKYSFSPLDRLTPDGAVISLAPPEQPEPARNGERAERLPSS